ncbi:hypothetical protein GGQ90_005906, partial [Sphingobium scionense]|nr:hypothetical protein [Sphingobium scionense]
MISGSRKVGNFTSTQPGNLQVTLTLLALFDAGKLVFFSTLAGLATRKAFLRHLSP